MKHQSIDVPQEAIAAFCRRNRIRRLSLFGSVLREDFRPDSDIDMLVEFEPDARVSLFDVGGMMYELTEMLGRQVDLRTPADLSRYFRQQVIADSELLYAA
ncbi:MAG: nucleotidyltransferase family protein [Phycisphaeraceae bacterium]